MMKVVVGIIFFAPLAGYADSFGFRTPNEYQLHAKLKPQDYLYAPNPNSRNDLFETLKPVDTSVNLAVGSDCGRINVDGTLRSTFGKVLSGDYFKGLAQDIVGSAPMLAACYMSPTWCSILKHTQLSANFLTQTRLNQCQIIDKYVDSRTEDYYRERQSCVQRSIQTNGGDMEAALASCQNGIFDGKAGNWAGAGRESSGQGNALISDSVRWAGFDGGEASRVTELLKSMVGDSVIHQGNFKVEFGPQLRPSSPRSYLLAVEKDVSLNLCGKLIPQIAESSRPVTDEQITARVQSISHADPPGKEESAVFLSPDLVRNLSYLPSNRRERICQKLSQGIAMNVFTRDMNRSLDVLTVAAQNPNLPPHRKQEIEAKRASLKDQVELTLRLRQEEAKPMGEVMQYIAQEGLAAQDEMIGTRLSQESTEQSNISHAQRMNDCADGVFCRR